MQRETSLEYGGGVERPTAYHIAQNQIAAAYEFLAFAERQIVAERGGPAKGGVDVGESVFGRHVVWILRSNGAAVQSVTGAGAAFIPIARPGEGRKESEAVAETLLAFDDERVVFRFVVVVELVVDVAESGIGQESRH